MVQRADGCGKPPGQGGLKSTNCAGLGPGGGRDGQEEGGMAGRREGGWPGGGRDDQEEGGTVRRDGRDPWESREQPPTHPWDAPQQIPAFQQQGP